MKAVRVIHSNSVVVPMAKPFHKVHLTMDVLVLKQNSSVVQMKLLLLKDQISRDVLVLQVNMVAVQMELLKPKVVTLMAVKIFQKHRKNLAVFQKMVVLVETSLLRTSLMLNMERVPVSGTVDVAVMTIDLKQLKSVKEPANKPKERVLVYYLKFMVHAQDIIPHSTTILIGTLAPNSFMEVAWATIIDLKQWKLVRNFALLIEHYVSI